LDGEKIVAGGKQDNKDTTDIAVPPVAYHDNRPAGRRTGAA
jgi:hypothetical protein